jgi:hypothetical protein
MKKALPIAMLAISLLATATTPPAWAQQAPSPDRNQTWATVSTISVITAATSQLFMPRVYFSDVEATVGWKARWHVSVLAPVMTLTAAALTSEYALKPAVAGHRPGCDQTNHGDPACSTYGAPSTHSLAAFSALGHGTAVFLVDTLKWNDGRFHGGAFAGDVIVPLLAAGFATAGRLAGEHESGGQVLAGGGLGLGLGLLTGIAYSLFQRPECGYDSGMICW